MSQTVDINILVHASHTGSPHHHRARALLDRLLRGPNLVHVFWPVLLGYLRIVTHASILEQPLSLDEAMSNLEVILERPHVRVGAEKDDFWQTFREVATDVAPRGNLIPDSHLVALMHQNGVSTVWSRDRDLRKFRGITVKDPSSDEHTAGLD
jgi:toxin-antitoxin system PIN domain toxin